MRYLNRFQAVSVGFVTILLAGSNVTVAQAPGTLDTSFAGIGYTTTQVGAVAASNRARAMVLQPDTKIVVGGTCDGDFCLVRYLPDGNLDSSFGTNGKVVQNLVGTDTAYAMALQANGRLVMAGTCLSGLTSTMCAARFTTSGALDTTFGSANTGWEAINVTNGGDTAYAIAVQSDEKIVLAGVCTVFGGSTGSDFCVARLNANGTPDNTFNATGTRIETFGGGNVAQTARAVAVQADGKIVVAGFCDAGTYDSICVARFLASGSALDGTFNGTGRVITAAIANVNNRAYSVAVAPNGKIVVGGECGSTGCVVRYTPAGALDSTFGSNGVAGTGGTVIQGFAGAIDLDGDGTVVHAGWFNPVSGIDRRNVRRWSSAGTELPSVATGPALIGLNNTTGYLPWEAVALQLDGKIVVAGSARTSIIFDASSDFLVARYHGFPNEARNCSLDIDGDGSVLATTDSLMHARIALGMTEIAVTNGITFANHALRKNWSDIRNYLVTQCGMSLP
jgi:uncharacterized delta-60 repeat protein